MIYVLVVLTYIFPLAAVRAARVPAISPLSFMTFFYFMQFGPQCLVRPWLRLAINPSDIHETRFLAAISLANLAIAFGVWGSSIFTRRSMRFAQMPIGMTINSKHSLYGIIFLSLAYCALFLVLDGPGAPRLRENVSFYLGGSSFSYTEVRRELFSGSAVETVMSYTRQSTTALLIGMLAVCALRTKNFFRALFIILSLLTFIICAMQLNKFSVIYSIIIVFLSCFLYARRSFDLSFIGKSFFAMAIPVFGAVLYLLYTIQYAEAVQAGYIDDDDIVSLLFYRPFMAQSDALRLLFEEFPDRTAFLGVRNIGLISNIFGLDGFDVTTYIPNVYFNAVGTSFQTGFIGSGYASFGYFGVGVYGILVGVIGILSTTLVGKINSADFRSVSCSVLCLNMYFLFSREFSTALLSGGIGTVPIIILLIEAWRRSPMARGSRYGMGWVRR